MKIEFKKIEELSLFDKNPRKIDKEKFQKLVKSIKDDPSFLNSRPILCYPDDGKIIIYAGNQRYKACKEIGITEVPVIIDDKATYETIKKRVVLDNIEFGDWDFDILEDNWTEEELEDFSGLDNLFDFRSSGEGDPEVDFEDIKSNANREKNFKEELITCPHCEVKFNIQV